MESNHYVIRDFLMRDADTVYTTVRRNGVWQTLDNDEREYTYSSWIRRDDEVWSTYQRVPKRKKTQTDELTVAETPELDGFLATFGISEVK